MARGRRPLDGLDEDIAQHLEREISVYGLVAYTVAQRTREIGIRMALGAQRSQVVALIVRRTFTLTAAGVVVGLIGAVAVARDLESLLFGLSPLDPMTCVTVAAGVVAIATLASYLPAHRATSSTRCSPCAARRR